ncbi:ABC transporter substrate-binding protein [Clostridium swellfunianum]|uniref:ABC transporter substrate-binding protein n=1 Tax=Clostridium swellfunianum TaxID=1367462 RepID=UPI00202F0A4E|nr:ABC transporter substrate-binding protein [Clostridium swellfunianum]MCM0649689.1 ABC transporter substrate-binding protein [Clostridium swellfunianum]
MKLKKITAALLCILLVSVNGCRKNIEPKQEEKDPIEGNITIWSAKENTELLKLHAANYNKIHSKVTINITEIVPSELSDKLQLALMSKDNAPDLICLEDEDVQSLLQKRAALLEETGNDLKKENYLKYKIENLSFEGKIYGFPLTVKPGVIVFRTTILEKNAINLEYIKTWEDFASLKLNSALPFEDEKFYRVMLNQLGGSYFDKEGKAEVNSAKALRASDMIKKLYSLGNIKSAKNFEEIAGLFEKGSTDSALISTESLGKIYKKQPELKEKLQQIKPPAFEEGGNQSICFGGANLLLINSSKNKSIGLDFAKFAAENRNSLKSEMNELLAVPAYTAYNDEKGFGTKLYLELAEELNGINYTSKFSGIKIPIQNELSNNIIKGKDTKIILEELQKNLSIQLQ